MIATKKILIVRILCKISLQISLHFVCNFQTLQRATLAKLILPLQICLQMLCIQYHLCKQKFHYNKLIIMVHLRKVFAKPFVGCLQFANAENSYYSFKRSTIRQNLITFIQ
jgi:hypothetical protein